MPFYVKPYLADIGLEDWGTLPGGLDKARLDLDPDECSDDEGVLDKFLEISFLLLLNSIFGVSKNTRDVSELFEYAI